DLEAVAPLLAVAQLRPHLLDAHAEEFLDRVLDLILGRNQGDLECVGVVARALVRALLGDERTQQHLVRAQLDVGPARAALLAEAVEAVPVGPRSGLHGGVSSRLTPWPRPASWAGAARPAPPASGAGASVSGSCRC